MRKEQVLWGKLVLTWCQTAPIHADPIAPVFMANRSLVVPMDNLGSSQARFQVDSSSWVGGHGLMVPLCSRNAHDKAVLVRRAQWGNHSAYDLWRVGGREIGDGLRRFALYARTTRGLRRPSLHARS